MLSEFIEAAKEKRLLFSLFLAFSVFYNLPLYSVYLEGYLGYDVTAPYWFLIVFVAMSFVVVFSNMYHLRDYPILSTLFRDDGKVDMPAAWEALWGLSMYPVFIYDVLIAAIQIFLGLLSSQLLLSLSGVFVFLYWFSPLRPKIN